MVPLQQMIISVRDMISKIQGVLTSALFMLLGTYYALQSLMGAIAELIIIILIVMAALIFLFWLIPFTWGTATALTAVFISVSIPLAIMLAFMVDVLHIQPDISIPQLHVPSIKCFDKDTIILMKQNKTKKIKDICVGDTLYYDGSVTAIIKVETKGSIMYKLNNIIVSDTHIVYFKNKWINVCNHPDAVKIEKYDEPYLYCLNTESKKIYINNTFFTDWDEVVGENFTKIFKHSITKNISINEIHKGLDSGFIGDTPIKMKDETIKEIQNICIGDVLFNGEQIYGVVEINGKTLKQQYQYILGKKYFFKGGPNIVVNSKIMGLEKDFGLNSTGEMFSTLYLEEGKYKKTLKNKEDKLYHLLTDKKTFYINDIKFYDYNSAIDFFT
jgi:hypothetical protein